MRKLLWKMTTVACLALAGGLGGCAATGPWAAPSTQPVLLPAEQEAAVLSGVTQLTFGRDFERAGEAYFSKDMRWVVFQAIPKPQPGVPAEGGYQMYVARVVRVKGEPAGLVVVTRISPPGSRNTCGWFSDDGSTLLFASTAGKDDPDEASPGYQREGSRYRWAFSPGMEIYRVTDWEKRVVTAAAGGYVNLATPEHRLTDNAAYDAECSFSPDGKWIVFCSDRAAEASPTTQPTTQPRGPSRPKQLYAMRSDGTDLVQLTDTPGYNGGPFFSPDGRRLVYRSDRRGNDLLQVYTAELVFGRDKLTGERTITGLRNERSVTDDGNVNWGPYWSADARRIVYATSKVSHGNYEIFSRRADGSRETRITFTAGPDVLPVLSSDGRYMMWASRRGDDKTTQIYVARITFPKGS